MRDHRSSMRYYLCRVRYHWSGMGDNRGVGNNGGTRDDWRRSNSYWGSRGSSNSNSIIADIIGDTIPIVCVCDSFDSPIRKGYSIAPSCDSTIPLLILGELCACLIIIYPIVVGIYRGGKEIISSSCSSSCCKQLRSSRAAGNGQAENLKHLHFNFVLADLFFDSPC